MGGKKVAKMTEIKKCANCDKFLIGGMGLCNKKDNPGITMRNGHCEEYYTNNILLLMDHGKRLVILKEGALIRACIEAQYGKGATLLEALIDLQRILRIEYTIHKSNSTDSQTNPTSQTK
jgi:hypothetical protein